MMPDLFGCGRNLKKPFASDHEIRAAGNHIARKLVAQVLRVARANRPSSG